MNNKPKKLEDLITEFTVYFKEERKAADTSMRRMGNYWQNFRRYVSTQGIEQIDTTVCKNYLSYVFKDKKLKKLTSHAQSHLRFCIDLIEFLETGKVSRKKPIPAPLSGPIGAIMNDYIADRVSQRFAASTIWNYRFYLSKLLEYFEQNNISSIKHINELHLLNYFRGFKPNDQATAKNAIIVIRGFFNFLYRQQLLDIDYSRIIPKNGYKRQTNLPSNYTPDEIKILIDSINRASGIGKRDYAIILLAALLGLRSSDIAKLQFSNIDWTQNLIKLTQYKTGRALELPLLPDIGNAIIDYLRYGRPKSNSPYIFLIPNSPYDPLLPGSIYMVVKRNFEKTDINIYNKKKGPHALRHSLAGRLLENQTALPVISEVLGHETTETTRYYLRIDLRSLRHCALEVPMVPVSFYTQKGGYFYA